MIDAAGSMVHSLGFDEVGIRHSNSRKLDLLHIAVIITMEKNVLTIAAPSHGVFMILAPARYT